MKNYHQFCGIAKALDHIGDRWTILIIRDLLIGPRSYTELMESLAGITTNLLADRLKHLQNVNLVVRTGQGNGLYELTEAGLALEPVLLALGAWGSRYLKTGPAKEDRIDLAYAMVSLRRRFKPLGKNWVIELRGPKRIFQIMEEDNRFTTCKGQTRLPDLVVIGEEQILLMIFGRGDDWRKFQSANQIELQYRNKDDLKLLDQFQKSLGPL